MAIFGRNRIGCPAISRHLRPRLKSIENGKSMIKDHTFIWWLNRLLIYAGFAALFGMPATTGASELKDIRIGEYDEFTRVVFEFSENVAPRDFDDGSSGRLTVAFPGTQPRLIRKIPTERSPRIDDTQLWQTGKVLYAILVFPFDRYRYDFFTLSEPDRIVIDIFPLNDAAYLDRAASKNRQGQPSSQLNTDKSPPVTSTDEVNIDLPDDDHPEPIHVSDIHETPLEKASLDLESNQRSVLDDKVPLPALPAETESDSARFRQPVKSQVDYPSGSGEITSRLQYFLMVGLVIITIALLGLLLVFLFSRQKIKTALMPLDTDDYFKQQDEAIASLNQRIQEQLKRYDEA